jgi:hypothetical protein
MATLQNCYAAELLIGKNMVLAISMINKLNFFYLKLINT